jgi:hypothetical protein
MNNPDRLADELTRQLHAQVDDWHSAPLSLDDVQGTARTIRRRRRALATGVAAVAVLAVAIPAGLSLGGTTKPPVDALAPPRYDGPVLGVPYVDGARVILPDGSVRELARDYDGGAVLGGTLLGLRNDDSGFLVLDELDGRGQVANTVVTQSGITFNPDESAIAYVADGELIVRWEDGATSLGDVGGATPVRLVGGPDCTGGGEPCRVYVNDERGGSRVITGTTAPGPVAGDPLSLADVAADGRLSMMTSVTDFPEPGSCSTVTTRGGTPIVDSCEYTYGTFSPDGSLLSGTHPYRDGFGDGWRVILDAATGRELARYESGSGGITSSVWEDDTHLLITSYEDDRWRVTRLGVDGSTEVVLGPVKGGDVDPAYAVVGEAF